MRLGTFLRDWHGICVPGVVSTQRSQSTQRTAEHWGTADGRYPQMTQMGADERVEGGGEKAVQSLPAVTLRRVEGAKAGPRSKASGLKPAVSGFGPITAGRSASRLEDEKEMRIASPDFPGFRALNLLRRLRPVSDCDNL